MNNKTAKVATLVLNADSMSYTERNNCINLTTEAITSDNQAYVIDKRLLDTLLARTRYASLEMHKDDVRNIVDNAKSYDELAEGLDNFLYMNKVLNHPNMPRVEENDTKVTEDILAKQSSKSHHEINMANDYIQSKHS